MAVITGGKKFEAALAQLVAKLGSNKQTLRVGFLRGATYPDGTPVPLIAAIQDYGAPAAHIPPRPFFRNMVAAKADGWPRALALNLKANNNNVTVALKLVGNGIKGQLQQSIQDTNTPPLAPATVARKGFAKPLIDTSHMINSVSYEIKT